MNFIFVSPHFPKTYWNFCDRLHRNGVNVLGIGDAPFDEIPWELKQCLTEYYRVNDLGNYDEMLRAVAYFTFHYGKIDWIESNNEYWLEMDAQLRTDFNINTGAKNDFIERIKYKSKMKESYIAAGVPVARHHIVSTLAEARAFIKEVGYPVIVKPDNGCGAEATYKLRNFTELKEFYAEPYNVRYIMGDTSTAPSSALTVWPTAIACRCSTPPTCSPPRCWTSSVRTATSPTGRRSPCPLR